jgi:hypothetical protein
MKLIGHFQVPKIADSYRKKLHEELTHLLIEATRAYIYTTADAIPVWGGASKATFSPLASRAEMALEIFPVAPVNTVQLGLDESTAEWTAGPTEYGVVYHTTLMQINVNEFYNANQWGLHLTNPGPYGFQRRGKAAFDAVVNEFEWPAVTFDTKTLVI